MMDSKQAQRQIADDLCSLGIRPGDIVLVHSSLKSLGVVPGGPETVIRGILNAIGDAGTLLMPALSYMQVPHHIHNTLQTPSNVGTLPEYFRKREGTLRSVHPTHSVCGIGKAAGKLFANHHRDSTPCGPNSPLNLMIELDAKIIMLGCGLCPNTTMHALEEYVPPPYLFGEDCAYTITDWSGKTYTKTYRKHGFQGWRQRYDRIIEVPNAEIVRTGKVMDADVFLLNSRALKSAVLAKLKEEPLYFVDKVPAQPIAPTDENNPRR